ncbi:alcohol dehydrogenase catalytic domain-containing protein [Vulcanisaeta thermophila]|uniref:alcohol dehydrogenase catalytic domain-containing protein n=1 Tax=Vulcanisaeta thermophila TaxID=867917 RepID=UPI000853214B|nr:alcohol dehydrogenase catalytic domain-containing protein [Vulcanisaeta thermophila]
MRVKAAVLREFNRPFSIEDFDIGEPGPNDVVVRVRAAGVCGRDLVIWRGGFRNLKPPLVLGHEIFGELNGKPVGVHGAIVDDTCEYCRAGKENLCVNLQFFGENRPGGYAEYVISPRNNVFELPDGEYEKYAASICPVATAIHASKVSGVKDGTRVLVTGAGGGVGVHAIQYLRYLGAYVIAVTSPSKADFVSRYADEVVTEAEFSRKVRNVDVVFEVVGAATINESLRALRREGTLVLIGNTEGEEIRLVRPALTVMREHRIIGSAAYTRRETLEAVNLVHRGVVKPVYVKYSLSDVNKAYEDLINRKVLGRAVLIP